MRQLASALDDRSVPADGHRASTTSILSAVCVVDIRRPDIHETVTRLHAAMSSVGAPIEVVVIVNGADDSARQSLLDLAGQLDHIQIYVMKSRVDYATALLAGIENAIGDWVATIDIELDEPTIVRRLYEVALRDRTEVVLSSAPAPRRTVSDALLSTMFHRVFRAIHGFTLSHEAPTARLLSRAVVNSLLRHDSPLVALETLTATSGHRKSIVPSTRLSGRRPPLTERVRVRWRTLIGINAVPLRLANLLCGLGALLAMLYSIYVVIIYLVKDDVVPGWTTLSLMLSGMFMMLALVLWLMSEYMLMMLDAGARRPRYDISEEFGGQRRSHRNLLNVESEL